MKTLKFKTNINCSGCVRSVSPHLDNEKEIAHWEVNIADPDKILTVSTSTLSAEEVEKAVKKAGFKAEAL
ncbi:heavy-metal-associated domain-containing protein [Chitinophaga sp. GCM10012297]|uniref:Heavy-metal-associated domain-containing protein n=1 Tax=Chitinophaga chungangae TaxID=2821488 RepID=A0ABS3YJV4_9BACT|nr:heavy-metal-associated domain-containing protein [Chitinophaga chungangae]MBO9154950.1 heavy-metal-associated domain-containing protein [Chitinophaga chungangae]